MAFTVLHRDQALTRGNTAYPSDPGRFLTMAGVDQGDLDILRLAARGVGTVSGGAVTVVSGLTVRVAASRVNQGLLAPVSVDYGQADMTLPAAHGSQDRWYLIANGGTGSVFGTPGYLQGSLAAPLDASNPGPVFPANSSAVNVYAAVFVPATTTTLTTNHIVDKRTDVRDTAQMVQVVNHGATAGTARPSGYGVVIWTGTVEPTNMDDDKDIWIGP